MSGEFIMLLGGAVASWPLAAHAQPGERMRRVGVLGPAHSAVVDREKALSGNPPDASPRLATSSPARGA